MWPFSRGPEQQPKNVQDVPKHALNPFTLENALDENRYAKFSRFLRVLFLAHMAAYPVREEIGIVALNLPRTIDAALSDRDPEAHAKTLLDTYAKEIDAGEPIPVDLATLYLEQEREAAGVSDKDIDAATAKFEEILTSANVLKSAGKPREEVMGFVLKQQGDYDDSSSLMTDLLLQGKGECEARQRFISAMYQRLYPEDVAAGRMRLETFKSWVDKTGVLHAGHVRVAVNQDDRVLVLEGDAVQNDPASEHKTISSAETTQLAVTGYAEKEGLFDINEGSRVKPVSMKDLGLRIIKGEHVLESAKDALHNVVTNNSVTAYPDAATTYGTEGRGTRDVNPHRVAGSWAPSHYDWDKALTLVEFYSELTAADLSKVYRSQAGDFDLRKFDVKDPEVMRVLIDEREKKISKLQAKIPESFTRSSLPFVIRPDQQLPTEPFQKYPGTFSIEKASGIPKFLEEVPVQNLSLYEVSAVPDNIGLVYWTEDAQIDITATGSDDIDPQHHLWKIGDRMQSGEIFISVAPIITGGRVNEKKKPSPPQPSIGTNAFEGVRIRSLYISGVRVDSFGFLVADEKISYSGHMAKGALSHAIATEMTLTFPKNQPVTDAPLYETNTVNTSRASVGTVTVRGTSYGEDAFAHTWAFTLISHVPGPLTPDTLNADNPNFFRKSIERVVLMEAPIDAFQRQVTQLGLWNAAPKPYIGERVGMVIFVPAKDVDHLASTDIGSVPSLEHQVELARSTGCIDPAVPVIILAAEQLDGLVKEYGGYEMIPDEALIKADFLKGRDEEVMRQRQQWTR